MKIKRKKEWNADWALHHRSNKVELDDCLGTTRRVRCTLLHSELFVKHRPKLKVFVQTKQLQYYSFIHTQSDQCLFVGC